MNQAMYVQALQADKVREDRRQDGVVPTWRASACVHPNESSVSDRSSTSDRKLAELITFQPVVARPEAYLGPHCVCAHP
jgi:hypothetical protein